MIIECVSCNKNFQVDSALIPSFGRTIQCGSCNHVWFFKKEIKKSPNLDKPKKIFKDKKSIQKKEISKNIKFENTEKKKYELTKFKEKSQFTFGKFLSLILVLIISFVGLVIVLDTFKTPLYEIFPNLELILYSLYEILKDIELFIRDLIKYD